MAQPIDRGVEYTQIPADGTESFAEATARLHARARPHSIDNAGLIRRDGQPRFEDCELVGDPFGLFSEWSSDVDTEAFAGL